MKKTLSLIVCAILVTMIAILPLGAVGASDWITGGGYLIDGNASPVQVSETDDGVQFTWGGYYSNGVNWGGFASAEKYDLDGLEIKLRADKITESADCWISIGLMEKPELFQVNNPANCRGYAPLIRHAKTPVAWGHTSMLNAWEFPYTQTMADDFKIQSGDIVTFSVKAANGGYDLYLNGVKCTETFKQFNEVFADGKAHLVISASSKESPADAFTFTVLSVNGEPTVAKESPATADPIVIALAVTALSGAAFVTAKKKH